MTDLHTRSGSENEPAQPSLNHCKNKSASETCVSKPSCCKNQLRATCHFEYRALQALTTMTSNSYWDTKP